MALVFTTTFVCSEPEDGLAADSDQRPISPIPPNGHQTIGRASLASENEAGGRRSIYSMLTYRTLFLVVIIELFRNSVFQLYYPKDYYKQKQ